MSHFLYSFLRLAIRALHSSDLEDGIILLPKEDYVR